MFIYFEQGLILIVRKHTQSKYKFLDWIGFAGNHVNTCLLDIFTTTQSGFQT